MTGIRKSFAACVALDGVDFELARRRDPRPRGRERLGQVDAREDPLRRAPARRGHDRDRRRAGHASRPAPAIERGIVAISQELTLAPTLTVAENILMGRLPRRARLDRLAGRAPRARRKRSTSLGVHVDSRARRRRPLDRAAAGGRGRARGLGRLAGDRPRRGDELALRGGNAAAARAARAAAQPRRGDRVHLAPPAGAVRSAASRVTVLRDGRLIGTAAAAGHATSAASCG